MPQTSVETTFANYAKLTADEKREFRAMMTGYDLRSQTQVNAGKKSAATKKTKAAAVAEV